MGQRKVEEPVNKAGKDKVVVVLPAYNAEKTLEKTYHDIPHDLVDEVILVDDASHDHTVAIARRLGIKVLEHEHNIGYGGNQKTCYTNALADGADVVVMLHPDYQYDPTLLPRMIEPILSGSADAVLGSRVMGGGALKGGMPIYKYISNRALTLVENLVFRGHFTELHTGYRAYSSGVLRSVPFLLNDDNFVFDSQMIAQIIHFGFKIAEIPVPTKYEADSSSVNFVQSVKYGLETLVTLARYVLHRAGIRKDRIFLPPPAGEGNAT